MTTRQAQERAPRPSPGPALFLVGLVTTLLITTPAALASVTESFTYDANGNRVSGMGLYFEYDEFNQLERVRQGNATGPIIEEYLYDEQGQRILKSEPQLNQTTYYLDRSFIRVVNDSGTFDKVYYHDSKDLVARKNHDGTLAYYHPDHLGSATLVTNNQGAIIEETIYEPFGKVYSGDPERFAYTGQELDPGTGLQYYGARYYDPSLAQFTTPDSIIPDPYNPQALNRYAYVLNNPYKYVDPSGNVAVVPFLIAGTVSGLISFAVAYHETGNLNAAALAGGIGFAAGAASVAVVTGAAITTAGAFGLRYIGLQGAKQLATTGAKVATIGTGRSLAEQGVTRGLSGIDAAQSVLEGAVDVPATFLPGVRVFGRALPGVLLRKSGQFFPSTAFSHSVSREATSQSFQTLYGEGLGQLSTQLYSANYALGSSPTSPATPSSHSTSSSRGGSSALGGGSSYTPASGCGVILSCLGGDR